MMRFAAYGWMLDRGLKPGNVAFAGDSAGGNLVLAAMLALRERGASVARIGRADVAMDRSGGDRRELREPGRSGPDPSAPDDPGAGKKLSGRAGRSAAIPWYHRYMLISGACRRY